MSDATGVAVVDKREIRVVHDDGPNAHLMDTARFEHMYRIATALATASLCPDHLKSKTGDMKQTVANCVLVTNQAVRWQMDPFAVAPSTYVVKNKLGFEGKLVAAVVNTRANLVGRLRYEHNGSGEDRMVTVTGRFDDEDEDRTITLTVRQAKTDNDMWRKDPDQKLCYTGATKWARRHCPEIMLGVYTDDDLEHMYPGDGDGDAKRSVILEELDALNVEPSEPEATPQAETPKPAGPDPQASELQRRDYTDTLKGVSTPGACHSLSQQAETDDALTDGDRAAVIEACEARSEAIRGSRGEKSNRGKDLFGGDA